MRWSAGGCIRCHSCNVAVHSMHTRVVPCAPKLSTNTARCWLSAPLQQLDARAVAAMGVQVLQWFERVEPHQRTLKLRTAKRAADPLEYQWREADLPDLTWRTGTDLQPRTSTQRLVARWQLRGSVFVRVCVRMRVRQSRYALVLRRRDPMLVTGRFASVAVRRT